MGSLNPVFSVALGSILSVLCLASCVRGALAQQTGPGPEATNNTRTTHVDEAMKHLAAGSLDTYDAGVLANANVVGAVPALEKKFAGETEPLTKGLFAQSLVKLHDGNALYWDYLANQAEDALSSDLPAAISFDLQGKGQPGTSDALVQWASRHQMSVEAAAEKSTFYNPGALLLLAGTGDRRAIPLLERALSSKNYSLHVAATTGLVLFDDPESVPLMIAACKRDPLDVARTSAARLAWSSNPEAQRVAGTFITKEQMDDVRKMKALGRTLAGGENLLPTQQAPQP